MVRPTAKVLSLLGLLQAGGTHSAAELARHLELDERTIRRYVGHLNGLDIPVQSFRGPYGGYRLAAHFRLPPLMLTDDEAVAVVWGLLTTERSGTGPPANVHVQTALAKVRRVLPAPLARRVEAVVHGLEFTTPRSDEHGASAGAASGKVLLDLAQATMDRHPVTFGYTSRHGAPSQRSVHPHGVVAHEQLLYLVGFDLDRQAMRTFRLDRITDLALSESTFDEPQDRGLAQHVLGPLAPDRANHDVSVRIRSDVEHVRQAFPETLASVAPVSGEGGDAGWLRVFLRAERLEWVAGRLALLDRPFVIEAPEALREVVASLGHQLVAAAQQR